MEGDTFTDGDEDMSAALIIPLILDKIFGNLSSLSLKSVRLVCKNWNEIGTEALAKKSLLSMKKLFPCCVAVFQPELINTKLARGLKMDGDDCYCEAEDKCCTLLNPAFIFNFLAIMPQLNAHLEELVICVRNEFAATLTKVLISLPFTKLNTLFITLLDNVEEDVQFDLNRIAIRELVFSSLKRIKFSVPFKMYDQGLEIAYTRIHGFEALLQLLFNSSPNLEEIVLDAACFYPDLSSCRNLKMIRYKYKPSQLVGFVKDELNLFELNKMLKSLCSTSIQELELDYEEGCEDFKKTEGCKFLLPKMDCLVSFILQAPYVYPLDLGFAGVHLPKLKHLSLGPRWGTTSRMELNMHNSTVTSLQLRDCHYSVDGKLFEKLLCWFPCVKRLDFHIVLDHVEEVEQLAFSKELSNAFTAWNPHYVVKLRIDNLCTSDVLSSLLEILSAWSGVTRAVQLSACRYGPPLEFSSRVKAAFLGCRTWQSLEINAALNMTNEMREEIATFLQDEGLPIKITN